MTEIPMTELWFIDIRKYVYDTLVNYVPLIQKIWTNNVHIWDHNISKVPLPYVCISANWWNTNSIGIRNQGYQIDVLAKSVEDAEAVKDIIIDLFNRRNFKWIKSKLTMIWPDMSRPEAWIFRQILRFDFIFKDMKF